MHIHETMRPTPSVTAHESLMHSQPRNMKQAAAGPIAQAAGPCCTQTRRIHTEPSQASNAAAARMNTKHTHSVNRRTTRNTPHTHTTQTHNGQPALALPAHHHHSATSVEGQIVHTRALWHTQHWRPEHSCIPSPPVLPSYTATLDSCSSPIQPSAHTAQTRDYTSALLLQQ
jgi:hypothetical protein